MPTTTSTATTSATPATPRERPSAIGNRRYLWASARAPRRPATRRSDCDAPAERCSTVACDVGAMAGAGGTLLSGPEGTDARVTAIRGRRRLLLAAPSWPRSPMALLPPAAEAATSKPSGAKKLSVRVKTGNPGEGAADQEAAGSRGRAPRHPREAQRHRSHDDHHAQGAARRTALRHRAGRRPSRVRRGKATGRLAAAQPSRPAAARRVHRPAGDGRRPRPAPPPGSQSAPDPLAPARPGRCGPAPGPAPAPAAPRREGASRLRGAPTPPAASGRSTAARSTATASSSRRGRSTRATSPSSASPGRRPRRTGA